MVRLILFIITSSVLYFISYFTTDLYAEQFVVRYTVPPDSALKFERRLNAIRSGQTSLGTFSFKNNTADGFELTIRSEAGGQLAPQDTQDGDYAIPYSLTLIPRTRRLDAAFQENLNPTLLPDQPVSVIYMIDSPMLASYAHYELVVTIDDTYDELALSGDYQDILHLTYRDL